jgi:hypothetical protein
MLFWHATAEAQTHRAALVVEHDSTWSGQHLLYRCVQFAEDAISGLALLELAGVNSGVPPQVYDWGGGADTICQLDREPVAVPARCFAPTSQPNWSDWHLVNGKWVTRASGVTGYTVRDGEVEGWTYSSGFGAPPPLVRFDQICPTVNSTAATPRSTIPTATASHQANTPTAARTPVTTPIPSESLQAALPSNTPNSSIALASTGATRPPPSTPPPWGWAFLGGTAMLLTVLLAINLRRRGA